MTSERKIAANRTNAKKGTGPKTEAGKLRTRFNALKFGIYALAEVIPGEDAQFYGEIYAQILDSYQPETPMENVVCGEIAKTIWRLGRLQQADTVAHKRAAVAIVANEVRNVAVGRGATEAEIDYTFIRTLRDEYPPPRRRKSAASQPSESEVKLGRTGSVTLLQKRPPPAFAFFKNYTSKDSKAPGREISAEIRTVTKYLLQLHDKLEAMQERRLRVADTIEEVVGDEDAASRPDFSTSEEQKPAEGS